MNIYFSNYAVGKDSSSDITNEVQLKVLLLLSNRVLIPPTHFLKMSNMDVETLIRLKDFFDEGYICTSLYQGFNEVTDYLKFKIENDQGYTDIYKYRLEKVEPFFESDKAVLETTDTKQGGDFSSIFLEQIDDYKTSINNSKIERELIAEEKFINQLLANSKKGFLYKAEVEQELTQLNANRTISKKLLNDSLMLINRSYFLAGAMSNDSMLSFSPYYEEIGLPWEYGSHKITNLVYSTEFFIKILQALEIVDSIDEIGHLSINDILSLKKTAEFQTFITEYAKLCDMVNGIGNDFNVYLNGQLVGEKKKKLIWWERISKFLIAIAGLPADFVLGRLDGNNPIPIYTMVIAALEAFCSKSKFEKVFERNVVDRISIQLSKKVDRFSTFCLLLKNKIETV